ncbi:TauD/TfdA family dioxygenase [Brevibacillus humidisoli]|uniref:TauD/TfdA family dioxygenase n=1 Tax=Brevibacillus humidisoli TaxID=2895522 RepID=UPI001E38D85B|nr:TauD/TfdA family dioxygenase [Brevibacillus humidisoli]UFJ42472.1 TauD/TfdA family dioxygenase [Brevibacillus humidisoli]
MQREDRNLHVLELTQHERMAMESIVRGLPPLDIRNVNDERLTETELLGRRVPVRIADALIRFRKHSNSEGTLLLRNLPVDDVLPATPSDGRLAEAKKSTISEYNLLLLLQFLGDPIAYEDEKEGLLIQNVCPVQGCEELQENTGSTYLEFHTEDGFHPYKPDFIGLFCLRPDHEGVAKTITSSIRMAIQKIPATAVSLLREPHFRISPASSFGYGGYAGDKLPECSRTIPVLSGSLTDPDMCIDFFLMRGTHPAAQWALDVLKEALTSSVQEFSLRPGDLLIVDNRKAAHARTSFEPRYDGFDRWLQRLFVTNDIRRSADGRWRDGYVCSPLFTLTKRHHSM